MSEIAEVVEESSPSRLRTWAPQAWERTWKWLNWQVLPVEANWERLRWFGNSRLLRTSYVWLIIVPAAAKLLGPVHTWMESQWPGNHPINLSLPFSWELFYVMAVCFFVGQLIYLLWCPAIVRDYADAGEYASKHHGPLPFVRWLRPLVTKISRDRDIKAIERLQEVLDFDRDIDELERFSKRGVYARENKVRHKFAVLCAEISAQKDKRFIDEEAKKLAVAIEEYIKDVALVASVGKRSDLFERLRRYSAWRRQGAFRAARTLYLIGIILAAFVFAQSIWGAFRFMIDVN